MSTPDKHTHQLVAGDVVAVRPRTVRYEGVDLEHRYDGYYPARGRWLTVDRLEHVDTHTGRVVFSTGAYAVAPLFRCAWYVRDPKETP